MRKKLARDISGVNAAHAAEIMAQFAASCPMHLPPPIVEVTRVYVSHVWSKRDFHNLPGRDHYEVGYKNIPAKNPNMWCDSRIAEVFNREDMNKITTALNFAHQQGLIQ